MHWLSGTTATYRFRVVITPQRNIVSRTWGTSVGKKSVMAVTGIIFLLYVIAHMIGNLKIFFGIETFDAYSQHLRELGEAIVGYEGVLWIIRVVLLGSVVLHMWAAFSLWYRAKKARPIGLPAPAELAGQLRRPHDALGRGDHRAVRDLAHPRPDHGHGEPAAAATRAPT